MDKNNLNENNTVKDETKKNDEEIEILELWEPETEVLFPRLLYSGAVPERRHP